jgi:hypothetical protein
MTAPDHRRIRSKDLLHRRGHPHMTHWTVLAARESLTTSRELNRFHGQKNGPGIDVGLFHLLRLSITRRAKASTRGGLQPFQAVQQSANANWSPFTAPCRRYPSLVQLARDGLVGDNARFAEFKNCRAQGFSSHVRGLLVCLPIVDHTISGCDQPQVRQHPHYGGVLPSTTTGGRDSSTVQLARQRPARYEASRPKLPNGRDQNKGAGFCGSLISQRTV